MNVNCIVTMGLVPEIKYLVSCILYTCFLDASKAFDRINHWTMFKKLSLRDVPIIIVRVLCLWCRTQELCIQ